MSISKKAIRVCNISCSVLLLALLVFQWLPFWSMPTCEVCQVRCELETNEECAACKINPGWCVVPTSCICEYKCVSKNVNKDCPVCTVDRGCCVTLTPAPANEAETNAKDETNTADDSTEEATTEAVTDVTVDTTAETTAMATAAAANRFSGGNAVTPEPQADCTAGHTEAVIPATEATCTAPAMSEGKVCSVCSEILSAPVETAPAKGHIETVFPASEATCTEPGMSEYKYCSVCNVTLVDPTVSEPPKGHTEVAIPATEATCTAPAMSEGKACSVCKEILVAPVETAPAKAHTEVTDPAVEATCTKKGLTKGSHCSVCNTVIVAQKTVAAKGHDYEAVITKEPTATEEGITTYTCKHNKKHTYTESIPMLVVDDTQPTEPEETEPTGLPLVPIEPIPEVREPVKISIQQYVWMPTFDSCEGVTDYFSNVYSIDNPGKDNDYEFMLKDIVLMPVIVFFFSLVGGFLGIYKSDKPWVSIFSLVTGIAVTVGYLFQPIFQTGALWQYHLLIGQAILVLSLVPTIAYLQRALNWLNPKKG